MAQPEFEDFVERPNVIGSETWDVNIGNGEDINIQGSVGTYAELAAIASGLGTEDAGKTWINEDDLLLYIWDGSAFPADGRGLPYTAGIPEAPTAAGDAYARENGGWSKLGTAAKAASTDFAAAVHTHTATDISDSTATGRSVLTAASASAARNAIGAGTSDLALGSTAQTAMPGNTPIPSVPGEISDVNIKNGSSTATGLISGRRFKAAFDEHLGNAGTPGGGGGGAKQIPLGDISGATPIDLDGATDAEVTAKLTGDTTINLSNVPAGKCTVTLFLLQDGTGGWELTHPGSTSFFSGQDGSINVAPGSVSVVTYVTLDGGTTWMAAVTDARGIDPGQDGITGNEPLRLFPAGDGDFYVTFTEAVQLDLTNAVIAGTGDVAWELDSGDDFEEVSGKGNVHRSDVLKAVVSNYSGYLAIAVPQGAPGDDDLAPEPPAPAEKYRIINVEGTSTINGLEIEFDSVSDVEVWLDPLVPATGKVYLEWELISGSLSGTFEWGFFKTDAETPVANALRYVSTGNMQPSDVAQIAVDFSNSEFWTGRNNGIWIGDSNADPTVPNSGAPFWNAAGAPEIIFLFYEAQNAKIKVKLRAADWTYSPPSGYGELA